MIRHVAEDFAALIAVSAFVVALLIVIGAV